MGPKAPWFSRFWFLAELPPPSLIGFPLPNISLNALPKSLASDDDSPQIYRSKLNEADAFKTCDPWYETLVEFKASGNKPIKRYSKKRL